jgi:farnesyl diphosphate synthase
MTDFYEQMRRDAAACEAVLDRLMSARQGPATRLADAMRYAVLNGGKRMRAALLMGASRLARDESVSSCVDEYALRAAAAVECLHAYSLVHDDLPSMDNAETRRGKPSCHILFDEPTAVLAGDSLQSLAFEILANTATHPDPATRLELVWQLATSSGLDGMAGGQMLDLEAEKRAYDLAETKAMQMMKTGALISCAVISGGLVGGADDTKMEALKAYGRNLGLAFQIADDLLDYDGDAAALGKPTGRDVQKGKAGFVALMGREKAAAEARRMIDEANAALVPWKDRAGYLHYLALFAITRET